LCSSIAVRRFFRQRLSSSSSLSPPLLCSGFFSRHHAWTFVVGRARRRYPLRRVGLKNPGCRWLSPHSAAPGVFKYPAVEPLRSSQRSLPASSSPFLLLALGRAWAAPSLLLQFAASLRAADSSLLGARTAISPAAARRRRGLCSLCPSSCTRPSSSVSLALETQSPSPAVSCSLLSRAPAWISPAAVL
jgi:hypothetical protein